jgi:radical SAM protein with 4Fe4S-binding SPASM domain
LVFWETTVRCNLACAHCRRVELDTAANHGLDGVGARDLVGQVAACGRPVLVFSGGEPLLREDLFELIARARGHGLPVAVATNGTLVDGAVAQRIANAGVERVSVSLDGCDAATHDGLRRIPGSFAAALNGIERLRAAGVSVQINCTLTRRNAAQLDDMHRLACFLGADALHMFVLVPVGCGRELSDDDRLDPLQQERALLRLAELAVQPGPFIKATCAPHYHRILAQRAARGESVPAAGHHLATRSRGCLAGTGVCFLSHRGEVFPCGYLPVPAGHLREPGGLPAIWAASPLFARLRNPTELHGRCGRCAYERLCGGCRARALAEHGDAFADEPGCLYRPRNQETRA